MDAQNVGSGTLGEATREPSPRRPGSCLQRFADRMVASQDPSRGGRGSPGFPGGSWRARHWILLLSCPLHAPQPPAPRPAFGPYCGARIPEGCSWGAFCFCSTLGMTPGPFRRCREGPLGRAGSLPPAQLRRRAGQGQSRPSPLLPHAPLAKRPEWPS